MDEGLIAWSQDSVAGVPLRRLVGRVGAIAVADCAALGLQEDEPSASSGSKKFLLVAALILIAVVGYIGWSRMHSRSVQTESPASQMQTPAPSETSSTGVESSPKPSAELKESASPLSGEVQMAPGVKVPITGKPTITVEAPSPAANDVPVSKTL